MAKSGVTMNWNGMDKRFGQAAIELSKTDLLLNTVGASLVSSTIDRFQKEISPDGKAWKKSKRAEAESGQTLSDTGDLRNSISYKSDGASVTIGSANTGTNKKYARIHQYGGKCGRGKKVIMPARPFIGINNEDKKEIGAAINNFIAGAFKV